MAQLGSAPPPAPAPEERLESWKEIAAYLKKSVRTVQEWEKKEGLPVHRHQHEKLGTVYAYRAEIDAWWRDGHARLAEKDLAKSVQVRRLALCGLLAGFTSNVLQFIANRLFLANEWRTTLKGLGFETGFGIGTRFVLFVLILLGGILAVWLYTILRLRFGPGLRTAALAGLAFWLLSWALPALIWSLSMSSALPIPPMLLATHLGVHLMINVLATGAGAWALEKHAGQKGKQSLLAAAAVVAVTAIGAAVWWPQAPALPFDERDWVLIAQFENRTGEPVFDGTLEYALERELSNSRFVNVVPRERVNDTLLLMRQPTEAALTASLAREVALRDGGIHALLTGRVEKLDSTYLLSAALVSPVNGATVKSFSSEAKGQKEVVRALRQLSRDLRASLGEALVQVHLGKQKYEKVTTPSLRALQLYSQGMTFARKSELENAAALFEQAVVEDPQFALAHIMLGDSIWYQVKRAEAAPHYERAFQLASGVSDRERHWIEGEYWRFHSDYVRAARSYETLLAFYPDEERALSRLVNAYTYLERNGESLPLVIQRAEARPTSFLFNYEAAVGLIRFAQDVERAKLYAERARQLATGENREKYPLQSLQLDLFNPSLEWAAMRPQTLLEELNRLQESSGPFVDGPALTLAGANLALGRIRAAEALLSQIHAPRYMVVRQEALVVAALMRGDRIQARHRLGEILRMWRTDKDSVHPLSVMLLVREGYLEEAAVGLRHLTESPDPSFFMRLGAKSARAQLTLAQGHATDGTRQAEEALKESWNRYYTAAFFALNALATAHQRQGKRNEAIALLERAAENREVLIFTRAEYVPFWVEGQLKLGELYDQTGQGEKGEAKREELRRLLTYADEDHAIARDLRRLPTHAVLRPAHSSAAVPR